MIMGFLLNLGRALAGKEKPVRNLLEAKEAGEFQINQAWTGKVNALLKKLSEYFPEKGDDLAHEITSAVFMGSNELKSWGLNSHEFACVTAEDYEKREVGNAVIIEASRHESIVRVWTRLGHVDADNFILDRLLFSIEADAKIRGYSPEKAVQRAPVEKEWEMPARELTKREFKTLKKQLLEKMTDCGFPEEFVNFMAHYLLMARDIKMNKGKIEITKAKWWKLASTELPPWAFEYIDETFAMLLLVFYERAIGRKVDVKAVRHRFDINRKQLLDDYMGVEVKKASFLEKGHLEAIEKFMVEDETTRPFVPQKTVVENFMVSISKLLDKAAGHLKKLDKVDAVIAFCDMIILSTEKQFLEKARY